MKFSFYLERSFIRNFMYSIFATLFTFSLSPFNWIVALVLTGLLTKRPKWKKRSFMAAIVIFIIFSNQFLLTLYARNWDIAPAPLEKGKVYSAAIILGGFTSEDKNGKGFFNEHSDRLIAGMRLKTTGQVARIMMSGGNNDLNPDKFTEAGWVKKTLKEFNMPDSVMLIDDQSKNTSENAGYTKNVLVKAHLQPPYLLVTSAFHMRRALYIFRKKGIDVIPYPCDYVAGNTSTGWTDYFVPGIYPLSTWNYYIKELFGLMVAHLQG